MVVLGLTWLLSQMSFGQSGVKSWCRQLVVQSVLLVLVFFLLSWSEAFSQVCRPEVDVAHLPRIENGLI